MPCAECLEQQKILIRLTSALHEREQQYEDLNGKFTRYKLQTKGKFALLKHQILDGGNNEDAGNSASMSNLLLRLDETDGQLSQFKDQIDDLKTQLDKKEREKSEYETQLRALRQQLNENGRKKASNPKTDDSIILQSASNRPASDSDDQNQQMYAQLVYKDQKILELSRIIDEQDQKVMDWQEACKDRDEVNKAKTKAIQILQEQLSKYVNKKRKDQATETETNFEASKISHTSPVGASPTPGRAIAFYKEGLKKDDEESSFTTDLTANDFDISGDAFKNDAILKEGKNIDKLNTRLSGLLQQVESMQQRVVKNDLSEMEQSFQSSQVPANQQPMLLKKKKEKKVTFDFSEQQRLAEIAELQEKLQKCDLACSDLRDENDELRMTIADLEQKLDERIAKNEYFEKFCTDLEYRLEVSDRESHDLSVQLDDAKKEAKTYLLKSKALTTSKIKELEENLVDKTTLFEQLEEKLKRCEEEFKRNSSAQEETVKSLRDDLTASHSSQRKLQESLQDAEAEIAVKTDTLKAADVRLQALEKEKSELSKNMEDVRRELKNQNLKNKAQSSVRIKQLEEELDDLRRDFIGETDRMNEEIENLKIQRAEFEERQTTLLANCELLSQDLLLMTEERDSYLKQKDNIVRDLDELKDVIQTSQEMIDFLESDLELSYAEMEELRRKVDEEEDEKRTDSNVSKINQLKFKAYMAKMRSLQKDNERLDDELNQLNEKCEQLKNERYLVALELESVRAMLEDERSKTHENEENYTEIYSVYERASKDTKIWLDKIADLESIVEQKSQEVGTFNELVRQKDEALTHLRQQFENLTQECDSFQRQNKILMDEKQEIEGELQKLWHRESLLKKHLADLEIQFDDVNKEKTSLTDQSDEYAEQVQQITFKLQKMVDEKSEIVKENSSLKERIRILESTSSQQSTAIAEQMTALKTLLKSADEEKSTMKLGLNRLQLEMNDLREDKKLAEHKLNSLNQVLNEEREKKGNEKQSFEISLHQVAEQCRGYESILEQRDAEIELLLKQIGELQANIAVSKDECKNQTLESEKRELSQRLNEEETKRVSVERELSEKQKNFDDFVTQLNLLDDKLRSTENRVEEVLKEKFDLEEQLSNLLVAKTNVDNLRSDLIVQNEELTAKNGELTKYVEECETLRNSIAELQKELNDVRSQAEAEHMEQKFIMQEHFNTIEHLRSLNEELQSKLALKHSKIAVMGAELSDLKANVDLLQRSNELGDAVDASGEDVSNLHAQIRNLTSNLETMKAEKEKLTEERQTLCAEVIHLNNNLQEAQNNLEAQTIVVDGMSRSIDEVIKENERLRGAFGENQDFSEILRQKQSIEEAYQQLYAYYTQLQSAYDVLVEQSSSSQIPNEEMNNFGIRNVVETNVSQIQCSQDNNFSFSNVRTEQPSVSHPQIQDSALPDPSSGAQLAGEPFLPISNNFSEFIRNSSFESLEVVANPMVVNLQQTPITGGVAEVQSTVRFESDNSNETVDELTLSIQTLEIEKLALEERLKKVVADYRNAEDSFKVNSQRLENEKNYLVAKLKDQEVQEELIEKLQTEVESLKQNIKMRERLNGEQLSTQMSDVSLGSVENLSDNIVIDQSTLQLRQMEEEINFLKSQKEEFEKRHSIEVDAFKHQVFSLNEEVRGLSQHISMLVSEIDNYKAKYRRSEERTNVNDANFEKLREETLSTEALLREEIIGLKNLCQTFDAERTKCANQLNEELKQKNQLNENAAALEANIREKVNEIEVLQNVIKEFKGHKQEELEPLLNELAQMKQQFEETTVEKNRLHEKLRNIFIECDSLTAEKERLEENIKRLSEELTVGNEFRNADERNKELHIEVEYFKAKMQSLEDQLAAATVEQSYFEEKSQNAEATIEVLNEQIKTYAEQVTAAEQRATAAHDECKCLQAKLSDLEETFANASMNNEELAAFWSKKCDEVENQLRCSKAQIDSLDEERVKLLAKIAEMKSNDSNDNAKLVELNQSLVKLEQEKSHLLKRLSDAQRSGDDELHEVKLINDALKLSLETKTSELREYKVSADSEMSTINETLSNTRSQLKLIEDENNSLKESCSELRRQLAESIHFETEEEQLLSSNILQYQSKEEALRDEIQLLLAEVSEKEKEIEEALLCKKTIEEEKLQLTGQFETLQATYAQIYEAYCNLSTLKTSADEEIKNCIAENEQLKAKLEELKNCFAENLQQATKMQELESYKSENLQLATKLEELKNSEAENSRLINKLQELENCKAENVQLTANVEELKNSKPKFVELAEKYKLVCEEHSTCGEEIAKAMEEIDELKDQLEAIGESDERIAELTRDVKRKQEEINKLKWDLDEANDRYEEQQQLASENVENVFPVDRVSVEVQTFDEEAENWIEKCDILEGEKEKWRKKSVKFEELFKRYKEKSDEFECQVKILHDTNQSFELACDGFVQLKTDNKELSEKLAALTVNFEKLNAELVTFERNLIKETSEKIAAEKRLIELDIRLKDILLENEKTSEEFNVFKKKMSSDNEGLTEKVRLLEGENIDLKNQLSSISCEETTKQLVELQAENAKLSGGTVEVSKKFENVKREYHRKIKDLNDELEMSRRENEQVTTFLRNGDVERNEMKQKMQELNLEIANLKLNAVTYQQKSADEIHSMRDQFTSMETEKSKVVQELNVLKISYDQVCQECETLRGEIAKMNAERISNIKLTDELKRASQEAHLLISNLEHERSAHGQVQRETGELKEHLTHTEQQLESYRHKLADRDSLRDKLGEVEKQLQVLNAENRDFVNKDRKNRSELAKLNQHLASERESNAELQRKLEEIVKECSILKEQLRTSSNAKSSHEYSSKSLSPPSTEKPKMKTQEFEVKKKDEVQKVVIQKVVKTEIEHLKSEEQKSRISADRDVHLVNLGESDRQRSSNVDAKEAACTLDEVGSIEDSLLAKSTDSDFFDTTATISLAVNPSATNRLMLYINRNIRRFTHGSRRRLNFWKMFVFIYLFIIHLFLLTCWLR